MQFNSVHAFKAHNIAFRENPRKRAGMHPNSGFGPQKDEIFDKDSHSFSRKSSILGKMAWTSYPVTTISDFLDLSKENKALSRSPIS